ncbi:MAG: stage II sporulation protein M [Clostridiales bacterium]|jgi:uncharacterized membrane protein SpoIIM required for sporulation|nr:stage II sporulation protein M [Clostridiales bacterium]
MWIETNSIEVNSMKEDVFINKNLANWQKLENYNKQLRVKNLSSFKKAEIREFADLFRQTGYNLAYSRTHFGGGRTTQYLNRLACESHNYFFTKKQGSLEDIAAYFIKTFPEKFRQHAKFFMAAALCFFLGAALSMALGMADSQYLRFIVPVTADGVNLSASQIDVDYSLLSAFIMTNNIRVSLMAFAWGITGGVGSVLVILWNGMVIGGFISVVTAAGFDLLEFWSLILPHGVLELTAIFLSGAAGMMIGKGLLMPGERSRKDAVIIMAKEAALFVPGITVMLVLAGLIEGFFTPLDIHPVFKLVFAAATLIGLGVYFRLADITEPDKQADGGVSVGRGNGQIALRPRSLRQRFRKEPTTASAGP